MLTPEDIQKRLEEKLPGCSARAQDLTGGGDHWQVAIKAPQFAGLTLIKQHQLVYQALGDWMHRDIHALSLQTSAS